eukprot:14110864-Ditylum_brightwellii.AAC.1
MDGQEVPSNVSQIFSAELNGVMGVPITLVGDKGNVRASIVGDIRHRPNDTGIVEVSFKGSTIFALSESGFGSKDTNRISILKAKGNNDAINVTRL